jgi:hypothetical protein
VDEPWSAFKARAKAEAGKVRDAASLCVGGLPDAVTMDWKQAFGMPRDGASDPPRGAVVLPEAPLHASQIEALQLIHNHRRVTLVCGRRWGKSTILITLVVDAALSGKRVGLFAPPRTLMSPLLMEIARALRPIPGASINTVLGEIRLPNGGHCDFWSNDLESEASTFPGH